MSRPDTRAKPRGRRLFAAGLVSAAILAAVVSRARWLDFGFLLDDTPPGSAPEPCLEPPAPVPDAFPWSGVVTLVDQHDRALTWAVCRVDGEVRITAVHPHWEVEHRAKSDGTPLLTVHRQGGVTTRITWTEEGAQVERTNVNNERSVVTIQEKGLWDGDTLGVRLAGMSWSDGVKVHLRLIDVDLGDGTTYPMVAEYAGQERCGDFPCVHVHVALGDFRRTFAPSFDYRYALEAGAKCLQYDGDGLRFTAR